MPKAPGVPVGSTTTVISTHQLAPEELMKAAVVRDFRQPLVIEHRPVPTPGHGEIVVRIEASGSATRTFTQRMATGP